MVVKNSILQSNGKCGTNDKVDELLNFQTLLKQTEQKITTIIIKPGSHLRHNNMIITT